MSLGNLVRVALVLGAATAAIGSAASNQNSGGYQQQPTSAYNSTGYSPPPPQEMEAARALGLWRSTFGAVKIEADNSRGGLETGALQGVWVYQRQGEEVVGYFAGHLRGNVLSFRWQEPSNPPLVGEGYIVFDRSGRQYSGRWWSERKDRVGDWNGWRNGANQGNHPFDRNRNRDDDRRLDRDDDRRDDRDSDDDNDSRGTDEPEDTKQPAPNTYGPNPRPTYY